MTMTTFLSFDMSIYLEDHEKHSYVFMFNAFNYHSNPSLQSTDITICSQLKRFLFPEKIHVYI